MAQVAEQNRQTLAQMNQGKQVAAVPADVDDWRRLFIVGEVESGVEESEVMVEPEMTFVS